MVVAGPVIAETFASRLVESRAMTSRVRHLVLERVDGQPFEFLSGQWVSVVLPLCDEKGRPLRRSYSIASVPEGGSRFELVVTQVEGGPGSTFLTHAPIGTVLDVKGPQGSFARVGDGPALFVATGTGIAPFRGMLHDALKRGSVSRLWVLFGVRGPSDVLFGDELHELARRWPQVVRFEVTPARLKIDRLELPMGKGGALTGAVELGLVDSALPVTADLSLQNLELQELLRKLGVPHSQVVLRASGRAQAKGTLSPLLLSGETSFDIADFAVLDVPYDKRGAKRMFEFPRGKLLTTLTVDRDKVTLRRATA